MFKYDMEVKNIGIFPIARWQLVHYFDENTVYDFETFAMADYNYTARDGKISFHIYHK